MEWRLELENLSSAISMGPVGKSYKKQIVYITYKPMPKPKFDFRMKRQDLELCNICLFTWNEWKFLRDAGWPSIWAFPTAKLGSFHLERHAK